MDVKREGVARKKRIKLVLYVVAGLLIAGFGYSRVSQLKPAAPSVDRATVWVDTVKRGPMVREVRGLGTLVVEDFIWIPATFDSRVEKSNFLPGATLHANEVLMVLSNPQMDLDSTNAEWQIKQAEANYDNLKVQLETQRLAQQAVTEQVKSDMEQADLQADRDQQLTKLGLKSEIVSKLSQAKFT